MTTRNKNFRGQNPPSIIDDHYICCNFSQPQPIDAGGGTYRGVLLTGLPAGVIFEDCNLVNCEPPVGATVTGGNNTIKRFDIPTTTEEDVVDGETFTIQKHEDIVYGRWTDAGYVDLATPEVQEGKETII